MDINRGTARTYQDPEKNEIGYSALGIKKTFRTQIPTSLFATPSPLHQEIFYTVPRAGHLVGGADHHILRTHFPGHEVIYCMKGRGYVRIAGRTHQVKPDELVWINCHHPHEHGAMEHDP